MLQVRHDIDHRPRVQDLEIQSVFRFLGRNWRWLATGALAALALGVAVILAVPPSYVAVATLVVDNRRPQAPTAQAPMADEHGYVDTQIAIMQSDLVLLRVVGEFQLAEDPEFRKGAGIAARLSALLGASPEGSGADAVLLRNRAALEGLRDKTRVERLGTSYVTELKVRSTDPEKAALLANAIARHFIVDQKKLSVQLTERTNVETGVRVISPAVRPLNRAGPKPLLLLGLSLFGGMVAGAVAALLREALDKRLRTVADVEDATGIECLGLVPLVAARRAAGNPADASARVLPDDLGVLRYALEHPGSPFTESLRLLIGVIVERRTGRETLPIGFAAAAAGSGQSTLAANCAFLAARMGFRTLLVDADVRSAGLSASMAAGAELGGPDLARGGRTIDQVVWADAVLPLHFLPLSAAGAHHRIHPPPTWLEDVLTMAESAYDCIFVDLPPLLSSGDARGLARPLNGLVLVAAWSRTKPRDLITALRSIPNPDSRLVGVVLNKVLKRAGGLYG